MKLSPMSGLFVVMVLLNGCATIVASGPKNINLNTSDGNSVEVAVASHSGVQTMVAPTVVSVKKSSGPVTVTVKENECYNATSVVSSSRVQPAFFGNFIFGGLIGSTTDIGTGNAWTYDDDIMIPVNRKPDSPNICK